MELHLFNGARLAYSLHEMHLDRVVDFLCVSVFLCESFWASEKFHPASLGDYIFNYKEQSFG